jgi:hypothetical protein
MESGRLPAAGVDDCVLEALAELLGTTSAALRQAGSPVITEETSAEATATPPDGQVDRLFRGRRP